MEVSKKDWKLYREKIGEWQENYMDRLCKEYVQLLQSDAAPSDRFWALEERIKEDFFLLNVRNVVPVKSSGFVNAKKHSNNKNII